jgi:putative nucleotidyltransferase with HDIG domain
LVRTNLSEASVIQALRRIPPFPPVAAKLLALLAKNSVGVTEVSELIGNDPIFSGRLLQCVNSYQFGLTYPVVEVRQAVMLLGLERTRREIVTFATAAYGGPALKTGELRRCWEHTMATAILAEEVARACQAFTGVAYTAGILHDIGRLGLIVAYPREYEAIIRDAAQRCLDVLEFERERFGMHHTEAGRWLIEHWGLPPEFIVTAGRHHDACEGEEVDLLQIIHVACRLADALGYRVSEPLLPLDPHTVLSNLPRHARDRLRGTPDALRNRIARRLRLYDSLDEETAPDPVPAEPVTDSMPDDCLAELAPAVSEPTSDTRMVWPPIVAALAAFLSMAAFLWWLIHIHAE